MLPRNTRKAKRVMLQGHAIPAQGPLRVAVLGAGAAGLSSAVLLSQAHQVVLQDNDSLKVHMVNAGLSPYQDRELQHWLECRALKLRATLYPRDAIEYADVVLLGIPTNYIEWAHTVDTAELDRAIKLVQSINPQALMVIESAVPVGYTRLKSAALNCRNLMVCPAALRPGQIMRDRLHPKLLTVGERSARAQWLVQLLTEGAESPPGQVFCCGSAEAEALELLRQRYLITRSTPSRQELTRYAQKQSLAIEELVRGLGLLVDNERHRHMQAMPDRSAFAHTGVWQQPARPLVQHPDDSDEPPRSLCWPGPNSPPVNRSIGEYI